MPTPASPAAAARERANLEIFIPTFNEEANLPFALESVVSWADAVYVVDSESTDKTRQIAQSFGATVVTQKWLGYARQKNWAIDNLPMKADWVFILDADESITPELREELLSITRTPAGGNLMAGYYVNRLTYFMNRAIHHSGFYPAYNLRLFKRGLARYEEREVHEHMIVQGPTTRLKHHMLHNDRRGLEQFIAKHNRYSTLEAREIYRNMNDRGTHTETRKLERGIAIRRWLKRSVLPRLPMPAFWRFAYMYIVRLGFLDGMAGLRFALFLASYDLFISLKLAELRDQVQPPVGSSPRGQSGLAVPEGRTTR